MTKAKVATLINVSISLKYLIHIYTNAIPKFTCANSYVQNVVSDKCNLTFTSTVSSAARIKAYLYFRFCNCFIAQHYRLNTKSTNCVKTDSGARACSCLPQWESPLFVAAQSAAVDSGGTRHSIQMVRTVGECWNPLTIPLCFLFPWRKRTNPRFKTIFKTRWWLVKC